MDEVKNNLTVQIIKNEISDICKKNSTIIFKESWCSHKGIVRFTTKFFRTKNNYVENSSYKWKTGDMVMYEVEIKCSELIINCSVDIDSNSIFNLYSYNGTIKSWNILSEEISELVKKFNIFLNVEIKSFQSELEEKISNFKEEYLEGDTKTVMLNKYERNRLARKKCLEYYGYVCKVCGTDFRKIISPKFDGIIEVHHIVPISEIGEEYVVDPIKDLIPLCPNCHALIHSKKEGVYTVDELRSILNKI